MAETLGQFLTTKEVCERLGVSRQTIAALCQRGKLHRLRREIGQGVGGTHIVFAVSEVEALASAAPAPIGRRHPKRSPK